MRLRHRQKTSHRLRLTAALIAVVCVGTLCYAQTLDVPWYFDDFNVIVDNPAVQDLGRALDGVFAPRGLTILTFALNFGLAGNSLATFHLTNIVIHLLASCLALLVLREVFPGRLDLALLSALIFVAHPLQTQAVTYVVQRLASLAGFLCLAAVWLYLVARRHRAEETALRAERASPLERAAPSDAPDSLREFTAAVCQRRVLAPYLGALAFGAAAMLAKENAAVLPALLALCELLLPPAGGAREPIGRRLLWVAPFLLVPTYFALPFLASLVAPEGQGASAPPPFELDVVGPGADVSRIDYLSTEFEVHWRYLRLIFFPVGQVFDLGMQISSEPLRPQAIAAGFALAAIVAAALASRRREPIVAFGILWYFIALSLESSLIPLDPYFEHRLYLPLLGISAAIVALASRVRVTRRRFAAASLLVVITLVGLSIRRNQQWRDPVRLWSSDLRHGSTSYRSTIGLADALLARGDAGGAESIYRDFVQRSRIRCASSICGEKYLLNAAVAAERIGDNEAAMDFYRRALARSPGYALAHYNLGVLLYRSGQRKQALESFRLATSLNPSDPEAMYNFAVVALELGDSGPAKANLPKLEVRSPAIAQRLRSILDSAGASGRSDDENE